MKIRCRAVGQLEMIFICIYCMMINKENHQSDDYGVTDCPQNHGSSYNTLEKTRLSLQ